MVTVADHTEALLASATPGARATGLWTRNPGVVLIAAEFVKHDISLVELTARLGPQAQEQFAAMKDLQKMWFR